MTTGDFDHNICQSGFESSHPWRGEDGDNVSLPKPRDRTLWVGIYPSLTRSRSTTPASMSSTRAASVLVRCQTVAHAYSLARMDSEPSARISSLIICPKFPRRIRSRIGIITVLAAMGCVTVLPGAWDEAKRNARLSLMLSNEAKHRQLILKPFPSRRPGNGFPTSECPGWLKPHAWWS